jgi:hypothetical protein
MGYLRYIESTTDEDTHTHEAFGLRYLTPEQAANLTDANRRLARARARWEREDRDRKARRTQHGMTHNEAMAVADARAALARQRRRRRLARAVPAMQKQQRLRWQCELLSADLRLIEADD